MFFTEMLLAFLVLFGIALFFKGVLRVNAGEGFFLTASLIALVFFISSKAGTFTYGYYIFIGVAVVGAAVGCLRLVRGGKAEAAEFLSPALVCLFLLYLFSLAALYKDFIQHIDEFHHWAAAVKYMVEYDRMPTGADFLGGAGNYAFATSLFHLFFQKFTGYNEQAMYVSSILLTWIGFMLPFSEYKWKDWKKAAVYFVIMFFALYTLYSYGFKSLYVDVPTAAWAGGLVGWWINRKKKKADILIVASGLVMLHFFKASAGLLMALFVVLFMVAYTAVVEKNRMERPGAVRKLTVAAGILCALVVLGSVAVTGISATIQPYNEQTETQNLSDGDQAVEQTGEQQWTIAGIKLPAKLSSMVNVVKLSREKIKKTVGAFVTKSFGSALASKSNWTLSFVASVLLILILLKVAGDLYGQKKKCWFYMLFAVFITLCYSAVLFFSYLFMFAYELSVDLRSCTRYFSICTIFLFVLALTELLQRGEIKREGTLNYVLLGILFFFVLGLNGNFVPNATALDKENVSGYEKINTTVKEINQIQSIIGEEDRIYYICQYNGDSLSGAELYNSPALYYLDKQISNYLQTPWRFTSSGSNIRLEEFDTSIDELPSILAQGGYTYLWVHTSSNYLEKQLPLVLSCDAVDSGYLYKITYENGVAIGLELVADLAGTAAEGK